MKFLSSTYLIPKGRMRESQNYCLPAFFLSLKLLPKFFILRGNNWNAIDMT